MQFINGWAASPWYMGKDIKVNAVFELLSATERMHQSTVMKKEGKNLSLTGKAIDL